MKSDNSEKKVQLNNDLDDDINNLNEELDELAFRDDSEIDAPPKRILTEEEMKKTRKQLLVMFFVVVTVGLVMIFMLFTDFSFIKRDSKKENNNKENAGQEEVVNNSLVNMNDGNISINNEELKGLYSSVLYFKNPNISERFELISNNSVIVKDSSDFTKFNIIVNYPSFKEYLTTNEEFDTICETSTNAFVLESDFNSYARKILGEDVEYTSKSFVSSIGNDNKYIYRFEFVEDMYNISCIENTHIDNEVYDELISANKNGNYLTITSRIAFINDIGIYSDFNFTNLITNDVLDIDGAKDKMSKYNFIFINRDNKYYLEKVEKI